MKARTLILFLLALTLFGQNAAKFPTATAGWSDLGVASDAPNHSVLTSAVDAVTLTVPVADGTKFKQYNIVTFADTSEQAMICSISGNTLTLCARGFAGTAAAPHNSGVGLLGLEVAYHHNQLAAEVKAIENGLGANFANVRLAANPVPWSSLSGVPSSFAPSAHASTHAQGGADALSGTLAVSITGNAATATNGVVTTGSYSDPSWLTLSKSKVGLGSVENTALSTWAGSANITTLGTISTGTVPWANVGSKPTTFTPAAHASTHASGGSDPITSLGAFTSGNHTISQTNGTSAFLKIYQTGIASAAIGSLANSSNLYISNTYAGDTDFGAASRSILLNTDGHVGIGSATANNTLVVTGSDSQAFTSLNMPSTAGRAAVQIMNSDGTVGTASSLFFGAGTMFAAISAVKQGTSSTLDYGDLIFTTFDSTWGTHHPLTLLSNGNVGIGTTSPQAILDLGSLSGGKTLLLFDNNVSMYGFGIATSEQRAFVSTNATIGHTWGTLSDADHTTYAEKMRLTTAGFLGVGLTPSYQLQLSTDSAAKPNGGSWTNPSDARLKTNIRPFVDGLSIVQQMQPKAWELNGLAGLPVGSTGIGFIAQDVKDLAPYLVGTYKAKLHPDLTTSLLTDLGTADTTLLLADTSVLRDGRTNLTIDSESFTACVALPPSTTDQVAISCTRPTPADHKKGAGVMASTGEDPIDLYNLNPSAMPFLLVNAINDLTKQTVQPVFAEDVEPACDETYRSQHRFVKDDLLGDQEKVCGKSSAGAYSWKVTVQF